MSLSSLIVQRAIATIRQVEEALARQVLYGGDLVTNLLEVAAVDEAKLVQAAAEIAEMEPAPAGSLPPPGERARALFPADLAPRRTIYPLAVGDEGRKLFVVVAEALPAEDRENLRFSLGLPIAALLAPLVRVREALAREYGAPLERRHERLLKRLGGTPLSPGSLPPLLREAPVVVPAPRPPSAPARAPVPAPPASVPPAPLETAPAKALEPPRQRGAEDLLEPPRQRGAEDLLEAALDEAEKPGATRPLPTSLHRETPAAAPAARRRRGPLPLDRALKELDEASDRDALLDLFFDFSRQYFEYAALFLVHGDLAEGRDAFGGGASREKVVGIGVPLELPSILSRARKAAIPLFLPPDPGGIDRVLLHDLERAPKGDVAVIPLVVRGRTVALLYGDGGEFPVDPGAASEPVAFALGGGQAFERLILRKKLGGFSPAKTEEPVARIMTSRGQMAQVEKKAPPTLREGPDPNAIAPLPPPPTFDLPPDSQQAPPPASDEPVTQPMPTTRLPRSEGSLADSAPPPMVASVRPLGPVIPREDPPDSGDPPTMQPLFKPPAPHFSFDGAGRRVSDPPPPVAARRAKPKSRAPDTVRSAAMAVPPRAPPKSEGSSKELPSIMVDVGDEFKPLVEAALRDAPGSEAEASLVAQGAAALPTLIARFPGPIVIVPTFTEPEPPLASACGPLLRLLALIRRPALAYVLPIVDDPDEARRFWATYLLAELPYAEALSALLGRLLDRNDRIRRAMRVSVRALAVKHGELVAREFGRLVRTTTQEKVRRIAAIELLEEIREPLAVPSFISILQDDDAIAGPSHRALMTITRQDFGRDPKRWTAWWNQNASRHRIEWLIDALTHDLQSVRHDAGEELKTTTREYFGYYPDLNRRDRERIQSLYRDWWQREGKYRFPRYE